MSIPKDKYTHEYYMKKNVVKPSRQRGFERVDEKHQKLATGFKLPLRKTSFSAGYDFFLPQDIIIAPKTSFLLWTDIKAYMLNDEYLDINIRSSIGIKHNIRIKNIVGIIDSDYYNNPKNDGNIGLCLYNFGEKDEFVARAGEGIVQGIFKKYLVADNCNSNNKRIGGTGSTN